VVDAVLTSLKASSLDGVTNGATNCADTVNEVRALTHEAMKIETRTPHTYKESVDLFRIGKVEVEANPDGIDFSGALFETLAAFGQFNREVVLDTTSSGHQQETEAMMSGIDTAMAHAWLVTPGNTRIDQLNAGRD
jgi:hypothetical protein